MAGFFAGSVPQAAIAALSRESGSSLAASPQRGYLFTLPSDDNDLPSDAAYELPRVEAASRPTPRRDTTEDLPPDVLVTSLWGHQARGAPDAVDRALSSVRGIRSPPRVSFGSARRSTTGRADPATDISAIAALNDSSVAVQPPPEEESDVSRLESQLAEERRRRFEAEVKLFRSTDSKSSATADRWVPRRSVFASKQELVEVEAEDRAMLVAHEALALDAIVLAVLFAADKLTVP